MHFSAIFAKIWAPKIWDNSSSSSSSSISRSGIRRSGILNRRINRSDPGSGVQISLFFRSELAPPATELHPRDFQKTEKSPELALPRTEKTPRPWFRTQMALFCSGSLGTPSGRKKKRAIFKKRKKKSKKVRKSEIFGGKQRIY